MEPDPFARWHWGEFYKMCGITNRSVDDMKAMSLWEFMKTREGWMIANAPAKNEAQEGETSSGSVTLEEFREAMAMDLEDHTEVFDPIAEALAKEEAKKKGRV